MFLINWLAFSWVDGAWGNPPKPITIRWGIPLFVDKPVATLQFDAQTEGDVLLADGIDKGIESNEIAAGVKRFIVWGMNDSMFEGRFADATDFISGIENVICGDGEGVAVMASITQSEV